jgi:23S rRNA (uridine2552-2'-O)-methyltransferase
VPYDRKDFYFQKAKKENYAARSAFKLEEIDQRFKILKVGDKVLDLGAAPGSWSQYASRKVGSKGRILGIDLQPIKITLQNAHFVTKDLRDLHLPDVFGSFKIEPPFNVVLSDMAPKTTGIRITDQARSLELCELALGIALKYGKTGSHFACKLFHSEDFTSFRDQMRSHYQRVEVLRPKSTRKESKEIFLIGMSLLEARSANEVES